MDNSENCTTIGLNNSTSTEISPNRSKYSHKFLNSTTATKKSLGTDKRKPLGEKTKLMSNSSQEALTINCNGSVNNSLSFEDLFGSSATVAAVVKNTSHDDELKAALAEALKENEMLSERIQLLKCEVERLEGEAREGQEYAELYLLSKELIEQQSAEISILKEQLAEHMKGPLKEQLKDESENV